MGSVAGRDQDLEGLFNELGLMRSNRSASLSVLDCGVPVEIQLAESQCSPPLAWISITRERHSRRTGGGNEQGMRHGHAEWYAIFGPGSVILRG